MPNRKMVLPPILIQTGIVVKHFIPNIRELSLILLLSGCATIISGFFPNETTVYHPTTMGCEVVGRGYPFAYIADKSYLSPVNSVDWIGALLGVDQLYPAWLAIDFAIIAIAFYGIFFALWRLSERFIYGSGHRLLAVVSRIFNALLIVVLLNLAFLASGVVTGMISMPYYTGVLLISALYFAWRVYKILRHMPIGETSI